MIFFIGAVRATWCKWECGWMTPNMISIKGKLSYENEVNVSDLNFDIDDVFNWMYFSWPFMYNFTYPVCNFFRDDHGFSLLHWACKEGQQSIVDILLARGCRVSPTNLGDDTPLHLAAAHDHRDIVCAVCTSLSEFFLYIVIISSTKTLIVLLKSKNHLCHINIINQNIFWKNTCFQYYFNC